MFIGDGTLGEGVVYETFNIASKWRLPLLIVLEDNGIAQSTPQSQTLAGTIRGRAAAFGITAMEADTWHPAELVESVASEAAERVVRTGGGPVLLHVADYRLHRALEGG